MQAAPPPVSTPRGRPRRRGVALIVVALALICCGVGVAGWLITRWGIGGTGATVEVAGGAGIVLIASETRNGGLRVRAIEPGGALDRVIYEGVELTQMRISPDGRYVLLAARDEAAHTNVVTLVDLRTDAPAVPLVPEAVPGSGLNQPLDVTSVDWLSDGRAVFSLLYDPHIIVLTSYHPETLEREIVAEVPDCLWLSLLCPHAAAQPQAMGLADLVGGFSGVVRLTRDGAANATGYPGSHWGLASPRGTEVLIQETGGSRAWTIYPVTEGDLAQGIPIDTPLEYYTCADWSPSSDRVVIGPAIYDAASGRCLVTLQITDQVEDVWFVDENHVLALTAEYVLLADTDTGAVEVLAKESAPLPDPGGAVRTLRHWLRL